MIALKRYRGLLDYPFHYVGYRIQAPIAAEITTLKIEVSISPAEADIWDLCVQMSNGWI
jgi:hypothetical protein